MSSPAAHDRRPGPVPASGGRSGSRPAVWVAVGPGGSGTAIRFGVDEALRLHAPLHLVHVTRAPRPVRPAAEARPGTDVAETSTAARGAGLLVVETHPLELVTRRAPPADRVVVVDPGGSR